MLAADRSLLEVNLRQSAIKLREKELNQSQQFDDESGSTTGPVRVYDRLYAERGTVPRSIAQDKHEPSSNRGLDECTFAPKLQHVQYDTFNHSIDSNKKENAPQETQVRRQSRMEKNIDNFFGDLEMESGNQHIFKPGISQKNGSANTKATAPKASKEESSKPAVSVAPRGYSDSIRR